MITNKRAYSTLVSLLVVAGCSAATMKFYTLDAVATPGAAPAAHYSILVAPAELPPSLDRPQMVVQVAPNQIAIDELNCWAAPLNDAISRAVAGNLAVLLATHDVAVAPVANFNPTHRIGLNVQRFESVPGQRVSVDALWSVTPTAPHSVPRSGHTVVDEPVQVAGYDALAAAYSRVLAKMSGEIAAAIEDSAKKKP